MARQRVRNSCQNDSSSISSGTSRRQPSIPKRSQCSATPNRYSRTSGSSVFSFGQGRQAPPGLVAERRGRRPGGRVGEQRATGVEMRVIEPEPVAIRRGGPVLEDVVERPEPAPGVVEDAVEDDPHPAVVGRVEQLAQGIVATEQRIDRQVVVGVIAVVRGRGEDRVEVERGDAEILEIAEVLGDPAEVAALEAVGRRRRVPRLAACPACGRARSRRTDPGRPGRRSRRGPRPACRPSSAGERSRDSGPSSRGRRGGWPGPGGRERLRRPGHPSRPAAIRWLRGPCARSAGGSWSAAGPGARPGRCRRSRRR